MLMNLLRASGCVTVSAVLLGTTPAAAQFPGSNGVCALVNFQFCDQPAAPQAPLYAPEAAPSAVPAPDHRQHRRKAHTATPTE